MSNNETDGGTMLRHEIHAAIKRAGQESDITLYQALGALTVVQHDLIEMLDSNGGSDDE